MKTSDGKDTNVLSKTPEEIKKALECCGKGDGCKRHCPYDLVEGGVEACTSALSRDALAYIEQLEARITRCADCKHSAIDAYSNRRMCIRNGEIKPNGRIWFGVAVNDDHFCGYGEPPKEE